MSSRYRRILLQALVVSLGGMAAASCSDSHDPVAAPQAPAELAALILSNPAVPRTGSVSGSRAALVDAVVYASLPPGAVPNGRLVVLTNLTTGAGATSLMVQGGFDPVPLPAQAGDSVRIAIQFGGNTSDRVFYAKVPPRRPPVIVRSDPPPGRRDVPLNMRLLVMFSEPVRAETVTDSSVQLLAGGVRVPGTVAFADSARLSVSFVPSVPLQASVAYVLRVSQLVTDGDGEPLQVPAGIEFSTAAGQSAPPTPPVPAPGGGPASIVWLETVLERVAPPWDPNVQRYPHSRFVLTGDGRFVMKYYGHPTLDTLSYTGSYYPSDSTIGFVFDDRTLAGPWEARGTVRSDSLIVRFNVVASLSDFEDGTYVLTHGVLWQPVAPLPEARAGAKAAVWRGTIYVIGGQDAAGQLASDILVYDPAQNVWRTAGRLTLPVWDPGVAVVGDRIYVIGGTSGSADMAHVQLFEPGSGTTLAGPSLPSGRGRIATAALDGRIHVMGGYVHGAPIGQVLADHDVLDPATMTWSSLAPLPEPLVGATADVIGGRIYVTSGSGPVYAYDSMRNEWSKPSERAGIWEAGGGAALDGYLYLAGGIDAWGCDGHVSRYGAASSAWQSVMGMLTPRCFGAAAAVDGSLYVIGGTLQTDRIGPTSDALTTVERMVVRP